MSLNETVIKGGYCIGCGVCATIPGSPYKIVRDNHGMRQAVLSGPESAAMAEDLEKVCPFGSQAPNEDQIAKVVFPDAPRSKKYIGRHWATYAGVVTNAEDRAASSSGGIGRWLAAELLSRKMIDGAVHVVPNPNNRQEPLFQYEITHEAGRLRQGAKSAYYPTTLDEVVSQVLKLEGRFLFSGVPCFIKALRLRALADEAFRSRVAYTLGIVCGHMKTEAYAESIGWQLGIAPTKLESIDFRGKTDGVKASIKANIVTSEGQTKSGFSKDLFGTNYSYGLFRPKACEFCDDVLAETADITVGDAWLPKYVQDSRGTSIVIVRRKELVEVLEAGVASGQLKLDVLSGSDIVKSQKSGLRHRNEGLAYRLRMLASTEQWMPLKRVKPNLLTRFHARRGLYQLRYEMSLKSHEAFLEAKQKGDLGVFTTTMQPYLKKHNKIHSRRGLIASVALKVSKLMKGKKK